MALGYSYSLRLVVEWLKENGMAFGVANSRLDGFDYPIVNHGVLVTIDTNTKVSVQTHPYTAMWAFAETLFMRNERRDYEEQRWLTPEALFEYLLSLKENKPQSSRIGWRIKRDGYEDLIKRLQSQEDTDDDTEYEDADSVS